MSCRTIFSLFVLVMSPAATLAEGVATGEQVYERDVRPILKTHCFQCHGETGRREGELDLRLRRLIAEGGESGAAIEPGDPAESLVYSRMIAGEMPPEEVEHRPSADELEIIRQWIQRGAPTAQPEPEDLDPDRYITDAERSFWSFQPIQRPIPPTVSVANRIRTPIDQFVLRQLEQHKLSMSDEAGRRTLLRRATFDLLGLPPTPAQLQQFLADDTLGAFDRLIDRLLASPHYGERWGRHWLDVAGYADSEGYTDEDTVRPDAYKYRDYVIRALNEDKPFDQFVVEQLAGDELVQPPFENLTPQQTQRLVATGYLRMAPDGTGAKGVDQNPARNAVVAQTLEIVSTSLLGLTVGCAQCHDHRYDPITQADYYELRAIFEPALDWKNWQAPQQRRISLYTNSDRARAAEIEEKAKQVEAQRSEKQQQFIEQTLKRQLAKLPEELRETVRAARDTPDQKRTDKQKALLKKHPTVNVTAGSLYLYDRKAADELKRMADEAAKLRGTKPKEEFIRALSEPIDRIPPKTHLFSRGDYEQPQQELTPSELTILTTTAGREWNAAIQVNDPARSTTGRRLSYARWLTSGQHPLVARVLVNRVWLHHFGRGLAPTPGDFGALGVPPTHPQLLDWLASEFVASGWSQKHLHKLIMTSAVYRQSSRPRDECLEIDADNQFYWRMPLRRLEAEMLRDSILAISGQLNLAPYGPAVPVMADRVGQFVIGIESLNAGRPGAVIPMKGEEFRRSVYVQVRRSRPLSVLDPFDLPAMQPNCTVRNSSTVAPQSLLMMNSRFVLDRAHDLARRLCQEAGASIAAQVRTVWQLVFASEATADELARAEAFIEEQAAYFAAHPPSNEKEKKQHDPHLAALASFCHAVLSSNRFMYW